MFLTRDLARQHLGRPILILLCGRGEYRSLLDGELITLVHAPSRSKMEAALYQANRSFDVGIVEDLPWAGEDPLQVARAIRTRGIGTVLLARTKQAAVRFLRERITVDLGARDLGQHLDNAVWLACCETELMRRDASDGLQRITDSTPPLVMRYAGVQGKLAPSESTVAFMFSDAPRLSLAEGAQPLVAPVVPEPVADAPGPAQPTQTLQPSASLLEALRRQRAEETSGDRWAWVALFVALAALIAVVVVILLRR